MQHLDVVGDTPAEVHDDSDEEEDEEERASAQPARGSRAGRWPAAKEGTNSKKGVGVLVDAWFVISGARRARPSSV